MIALTCPSFSWPYIVLSLPTPRLIATPPTPTPPTPTPPTPIPPTPTPPTPTPPTPTPPTPNPSCPPTVFLNEIHYQNIGPDAEFIEVAHTIDIALSGYQIHFYEQAGTVYRVIEDITSLVNPGDTSNSIDGFTFSSFNTINPLAPASELMQNENAGLALVNPLNQVVDFISYGVPIVGTDGPAIGLTSTFMGVTETAINNPLNSLQLGGEGYQRTDFFWQSQGRASRAALNTNQIIRCPNANGAVSLRSGVVTLTTLLAYLLVIDLMNYDLDDGVRK